MLPTIIYLLGAIRRALKKSGRGLSMIAEVFSMRWSRATPREGSIRSRSRRWDTAVVVCGKYPLDAELLYGWIYSHL